MVFVISSLLTVKRQIERAVYPLSKRLQFEPLVGHVTVRKLDDAMAEFQRRVDAGEDDVEVLFAKHIPMASWVRRNDAVSWSRVVDARYSGSDDDPAATVDLYVTTNLSEEHEKAVHVIIADFVNYARASDYCLESGGGQTPRGRDPVPGEPLSVIPDAWLQPVVRTGPGQPDPCVIAEVEVSHRSLLPAQTHCRDYFDLIRGLNAVVLVKFFPPRRNGTSACVAILYRRGDDDSIIVDDVVSCGSASLATTSRNALEAPHDGAGIRELPLAPHSTARRSPWGDEVNPYITIQAAHIYANVPDKNQAPLVRGGLRPFVDSTDKHDLRISLWEVFCAGRKMDIFD
ncbi:hypothetical protein SPRG_08651 [Saprolegnia parasitica CBS 223.65]|uniref:Uncharacterized protein n=1 Tax=Saprolegnia parasitica (strain CBS 223.65) TaxID=695850 RepID=A0A067C646_SAPPC|nr:hypothetical protein SPRG_08651 [Saprolegnia parasitica CBS 223.65]KDO25998.1 hypothetical protein SPRG_08651 [Saprolegnia parasitica CBS 223.65]|eukprot:XP_012203285.1 hypothetical protein SPRG_08651 [Saprolegnia parasitica CBS 223.65]